MSHYSSFVLVLILIPYPMHFVKADYQELRLPVYQIMKFRKLSCSEYLNQSNNLTHAPLTSENILNNAMCVAAYLYHHLS